LTLEISNTDTHTDHTHNKRRYNSHKTADSDKVCELERGAYRTSPIYLDSFCAFQRHKDKDSTVFFKLQEFCD